MTEKEKILAKLRKLMNLKESAQAIGNEGEAGWTNIDGKDYCPDCYEYDEEKDEYRVKP